MWETLGQIDGRAYPAGRDLRTVTDGCAEPAASLVRAEHKLNGSKTS